MRRTLTVSPRKTLRPVYQLPRIELPSLRPPPSLSSLTPPVSTMEPARSASASSSHDKDDTKSALGLEAGAAVASLDDSESVRLERRRKVERRFLWKLDLCLISWAWRVIPTFSRLVFR